MVVNSSYYDSEYYRAYKARRGSLKFHTTITPDESIARSVEPLIHARKHLTRRQEILSVLGGMAIAGCLIPTILNIESHFIPEPAHVQYQQYQIQNNASQQKTSSFVVSNASQHITAVPQYSVGQYANTQQYAEYWQSACSAASMTAVLNAYGHHYHIADILKQEIAVNGISSSQGMLDNYAIDRTVEKFGFHAKHLNITSIADLVNQSKSVPIIVDFPPSRWAGGHILVVNGGDETYVSLIDSSSLKMQKMSYASFAKYWAGYAVLIQPN
jgi:hypothetical protein